MITCLEGKKKGRGDFIALLPPNKFLCAHLDANKEGAVYRLTTIWPLKGAQPYSPEPYS